MQHNDGWKSCKKISKPVRARIGKLVKAGVFEDASAGSGATKAAGVGQPTKQKRGTANAVVEEEDDGEETEVQVDMMPSQEHLLQMLVMSNTLVGNVNTTQDPSTKTEGCWDSANLVDLGFANI